MAERNPDTDALREAIVRKLRDWEHPIDWTHTAWLRPSIVGPLADAVLAVLSERGVLTDPDDCRPCPSCGRWAAGEPPCSECVQPDEFASLLTDAAIGRALRETEPAPWMSLDVGVYRSNVLSLPAFKQGMVDEVRTILAAGDAE